MNDNLPLGAEHDPRAPWNEDREQEQFQLEIEDAVELVREELADCLPDLIWTILRDHHYDVRERAYDVIYDEAKKLWEQ